MTILVPTPEELQKIENWCLKVEQAKSLDERIDEILAKENLDNIDKKNRIKEFLGPLSPDVSDKDLTLMISTYIKNLK